MSVLSGQGEGVTGAEVGIVTPDAERLARFYSDGLGFVTVARYEFPRGLVYRLARGPARCKLFQPRQLIADRIRAEPWYAVAGNRYGALLVQDAAGEVTRVRAAGGEVLEGVTTHRPGASYALIRDPEGNVWELLQEG